MITTGDEEEQDVVFEVKVWEINVEWTEYLGVQSDAEIGIYVLYYTIISCDYLQYFLHKFFFFFKSDKKLCFIRSYNFFEPSLRANFTSFCFR